MIDIPGKSAPKKSRKKRKVNWRQLEPGDKIYVHGQDYFLMEDGGRIDMAHRGTFIVQTVDKKGLHLIGSAGYCFQNMVSEGKSHSGIYRVIPKLTRRYKDD